MNTPWIITPLSPEEEATAQHLAARMEMSLVVSRLLVRRGIRSVEAAHSFFNPRLEELHDPCLMQDMDRAVRRLVLAIDQGEGIMLFGDYDVDGTTAVALLYNFLRSHTPATGLSYYIPDRYDEGYGISRRAIDEAHAREASLIISLDCGIKAHEEVAYARELGIDFIVCDHHQPAETLPEAVAVLDPKRLDDDYPCKHLSGCGVGFKLVQGYLQHRGMEPRIAFQYLDLLAISIAADIVPIVGENRILAYHGLKQLNSHPSIPIAAIMRLCQLETGDVDMGSIIFKIAPRINASGRMMNGSQAVELLLSRQDDEAEQLCQRLESCNEQRRELDLELTNEALELIASRPALLERRALVLYRPDWHKGVLGIVASRLAERFHRPTIILTGSGNEVSASARSAGGVNLYEALEACQDCLINFGGHPFASGLTIAEERIEELAERLDHYLQSHVAESSLVPVLEADDELELSALTPQLLRELSAMAPFGSGNEMPLFVSRRLRDAGGSRVVGKGDRHIKLRLTDAYCQSRPINAIALRLSKHAPHILRQQLFDLCYTIEENNFYGSGFMQLQVKDIHPIQP